MLKRIGFSVAALVATVALMQPTTAAAQDRDHAGSYSVTQMKNYSYNGRDQNNYRDSDDTYSYNAGRQNWRRGDDRQPNRYNYTTGLQQNRYQDNGRQQDRFDHDSDQQRYQGAAPWDDHNSYKR